MEIGEGLPVGITTLKPQATVPPSRAAGSDVEPLLTGGFDQSSGGCLNFPITMLLDQSVYFLTDPREATVAKVSEGVFSHAAR